jgi:hypothetical protein
MTISSTGIGTKNDCASEDQQQFILSDPTQTDSEDVQLRTCAVGWCFKAAV